MCADVFLCCVCTFPRRWDGYWVVQTLVTCAVLFPLVDPVLYNLWQPVAEVIAFNLGS